MRQFADRTGRQWTIDLTVGAVLRVRQAEPRFDLLDPAADQGGQPLQGVLATDLVRFWELLWVLVKPQADAIQTTAEAFGEAMGADCLLAAHAAFFDEWRDFFRSLRRPDASLSVETTAKAVETALRLVASRIETVDRTRLNQRIESQLEKEIAGQFGKARESLGLTPGDSPGAKSN